MKRPALRLAHLQLLANVAGAALLLWWVAPLLAFQGWHPFDGPWARVAGIAALAVFAACVWLLRQWLRRRRNARLFEQLQGADAAASEALSERFRAAMQLLKTGIALDGKRGSAWRRWLGAGRQVYQMPWYLIIGAPGAGKTTALLHSGLRFPLAERLGAAPVAGVGGTRQCDWWFTDRAVFIDTAGRYTTQDSHAASDAQEWQLFLRLLRRWRPVQPVNGVIVTVSVPDLLHGGAELEQQAAAVDRRLQELRGELGLSFPVYLLVTKADLLAGFVEFFGDYDAAQREQPWGLSFEYPVPAGAGVLPSNLSTQLAMLAARVAALSPQRMQQEPQLLRRAAIHRFAAQLEAILPALEGFARRAFVQASAAPAQVVRGIQLTSGTQEGNPIDRVLGELARSYGMALRTLPRPDAGGKAFFLGALLQRLLIAEAPLAGTNLARRRRRRWLTLAGSAALASVMVAACVGWWVSWQRNDAYVESVRQRVEQLTRQTASLPPSRIDTLLPLYELLRQLASSGLASDGLAEKASPELARDALQAAAAPQAPPGFGFGLFQGPRLAQAADQTYHRVLDQTLAPLLVERLSQALRQESDPIARYDALRITLMLVTPERLQRAEVRRWAAEAIAAPGAMPPAGGASAPASTAPGLGEQQEWLRHLDALLERNAVIQVVRLDDNLVRAARAGVANLPFAQRVQQRLVARAREGRAREPLGGAQGLAELAGPGAVLAFAPQDAASAAPLIPAVLTRQAWREQIEPALDATIQELADEAGWVLGDRSPAMQRLVGDRAARDEVAQQVAQRHAQAVIAAWDRLLPSLALQAPADAAGLERLATGLAAPSSPLGELMKRLGLEFGAAVPSGASAAGTGATAAATSAATASAANAAFEAALAARYGALADYARGPGAAALPRLLDPLPAAARDPSPTRGAELVRDLRAEAARAPPPLREVWTVLADALGTQQRKALDRQLAGSMASLTQSCRRLVEDRFPFTPAARRDMPMADFARLFGPQGLLDEFFRANLAAQVDTRSRPWRLAGDAAPQGKAQASLRAFEFAADIRRLFFAAGGPLPQLQLRLTPVRMDDELLQFTLDVDGQLLRYENGPRRPKLLTWPGPAATQKVLMRIFPAGPSGVDAEVHEGPWALLRVLGRPSDTRGASGPSASAAVQLMVDGRTLSLDAATDGPVPARLLAELSGFRCPEGW